MKKLLSILLAAIVSIGCLGLFASCGEPLAFGKELVTFKSQLDTLTQLKEGTVDVAVIDSVMAGYYTSQGEFSNDLQVVQNLVLAEEKYGIAGRKDDKAFMSEINKALIAIRADAYATIAADFGLTNDLAITESTTNPITNATDDSWEKIKNDRTIVVGYTVFAPIAFTENDKFTGFDIELARAVVDYLNAEYSLNLQVTFQEIDWDSKESLLNNGTIDLIWNGLTITEERSENMCISVPYLNNNQVAVIRKADAEKYTSTDTMSEAAIGVESGSAGESVVRGK